MKRKRVTLDDIADKAYVSKSLVSKVLNNRPVRVSEEKRLEILNQSNDGFFIAGEDLKLRGPGDFFGIRQSGLLEFRLGDIYQNADLLKAASEEAGQLLREDRKLTAPEHEKIRIHMQSYLDNQAEIVNL